MREYVISITDETKESYLLALLRDLSYVRVKEPIKESVPQKRFPLMDSPIAIKDFKKFTREELHER